MSFSSVPESINTDSLKNKTMWLIVITRGFFIGVYLISLICVLHPGIRYSLQSFFHQPYRRVLSASSGPLLKDSQVAKVLKVKTQEGLFIEVYGRTPEGGRPLLDKVQLPDQRDGYFTLGGMTSNLFIDDLDEDNILEILAPSFDDNLNAHLNVYFFNQFTSKLETKIPFIQNH